MMRFTANAIAISSILLSLTNFASAAPYTGTPTVERRAYVSAGVTCYYQCAQTLDDGGPTNYVGSGDNGEGETFCAYDGGGTCYYNSESGALTDSIFITNCPNPAPQGGCGVEPERGFRKRGLSEYNLGKARDDRSIIDRQFKYRQDRAVKAKSVVDGINMDRKF